MSCATLCVAFGRRPGTGPVERRERSIHGLDPSCIRRVCNMAGQVRRDIERGSLARKLRTAIHNIRGPVTEFQEPLRNMGSCSKQSRGEGAMPLSLRYRLSRLPKRFPVGTTFVIEGRTIADGKNDENLRVFSRFVVLPGGRRIDLGGDATTGTRRRRSRSRQSAAPRASAESKKIVSERGTTLRQRR